MQIYNLEYRVLDKLGRTKETYHGGLFTDLDRVEQYKQKLLDQKTKKKIAFDVYVIDQVTFR